MKFKIHHNGVDYPVTVTKKNGQFTITLTQLVGDYEFPSRFTFWRCPYHDVTCSSKHYKNMKFRIFEMHGRRFKSCS